jgi:hypothetical protein
VRLISRDDLRVLLAGADGRLQDPAELLLVGGAAVLVLCPDAVATKDLDAFPTDSFRRLAGALRDREGEAEGIDINTASCGFESYLPEDWPERIRTSAEFSTAKIRVLTPAPEDLAVMKVFRFVAKDAEDIARLAGLADFDRDAFLRCFLSVLPAAVGEPRWHAQSFVLIWNALYPDRPLETGEVLELAGG